MVTGVIGKKALFNLLGKAGASLGALSYFNHAQEHYPVAQV